MKKAIIAAAACAFLLGCAAHAEPPPGEGPHPMIDFDRAAFNRARAAWEAQGITCYVFETSEETWRPGIARVTVRGWRGCPFIEAVDREEWRDDLSPWNEPASDRGTIPCCLAGLKTRTKWSYGT